LCGGDAEGHGFPDLGQLLGVSLATLMKSVRKLDVLGRDRVANGAVLVLFGGVAPGAPLVGLPNVPQGKFLDAGKTRAGNFPPLEVLGETRGRPYSTESKGKVVELNFWATWCRLGHFEERPAQTGLQKYS